ncbi:hypothetical protein PENTCL1PPCAC_6946, partial [Pristionchus entomophagus]
LRMSSTSSMCSSDDFIIDHGGGRKREMAPHLRSIIERFSVNCARLKSILDLECQSDEGDSMCVSVHSALEGVNESMRELLRIEEFKTNSVILPSLQLVHSIKDLKFDSSSTSLDTRHSLSILDSLQSAVLNTLIQHHMTSDGRRFNTNRRTTQTIARFTSPHSLSSADRILSSREDGVDIAFERAKTSSRYWKELAIFVKGRLQLEQEHAKKVTNLVEQTRLAINESFLPLRSIFESGFDCEFDFAFTVKETIEHLNDRFLKTLETRRNEHDAMRRSLKIEWTKVVKAVNEAENEEKRALISLQMREETVKKLRRDSSRNRDAEKRKRMEEEAVAKVDEAQRTLLIATTEVEERRREKEMAKERTIERLRDLILQCDQTTKACASHYFKALSSLWMGVPHRLAELAERVRVYEPGGEFMSLVHSLPKERTQSRDEGSESSSSHRRNAINDPHQVEGTFEGIRRHKKSGASRLFERHSLSDAAASHSIQRTVQPGKCSHCDSLSLLNSLQCSVCSLVWHKACFPQITVSCGHQTARRTNSDRRMSIFGVNLETHLKDEQRSIPFIIESAINEIQGRGMRVKGIYRTCGVKSKVEEICELFEKSRSCSPVDLSSLHPMSLASVVKLYLRKLPQPLLTYQLYEEWLAVADLDSESAQVSSLTRLLSLLPPPNHSTLKFVLLHLNRVTWFHDSNLMCASNLSVVISPSLGWPSTLSTSATINHIHALNTTVKLLIRHAFELFGVDRESDWSAFSSLYSMEMPSRESSRDEDDEDDGEDKRGELDDEEEEEEQSFIPQPPTPDLLKSTPYRGDRGGDAESRIRRREKRRSYTTSILISPRVDDSMRKQRSVDESLLSHLTLNISKGELLVDDSSLPSSNGSIKLRRRQSEKEYVSHSNSDHDRVISVHQVGDLFPGTDVSYV